MGDNAGSILAVGAVVGGAALGASFLATGPLAFAGVQFGSRLAVLFGLSYIAGKTFGPDGATPKPQAPGIGQNSEGGQENRIFGRTMRVSGRLFWQQHPATEITESSGKGPGQEGAYLTYKYTRSACYEWNRCYGLPNTRIVDVWFNSDKSWSSLPDIDIGSDQISSTLESVQHSGGIAPRYSHFAVFSSTSSGPDLTQFTIGKPLSSQGWTDPDMNGEFNVWGTKLVLATGATEVKVNLETYVLTSTNPGSAEAAGPTIELDQSQPQFAVAQFAEADHKLGTLTQSKDSEMVLYETATEISAQRDRSYSRFTDIRLENFGNVVPLNADALIECNPRETVKSAVEALLDTAGIDATQRDTSGLAGIVLRGLDASTGAADAIFAMALAYNFMMRDVQGKLTFTLRENLPTVTIAQSKMAARDWGAEAPRDVEHSFTNRRNLPRSVVVKYLDPAQDYQAAATTYTGQAPNGALGGEVVTLPLVLTSDEAQVIAKRIYWLLHVTAHKMTGIQLPPSEVGLVAGTIVNVTDNDRSWNVLAESVLTGVNEIMVVEGVEEQSQVHVQTATVDDPG